MSRCGLLGRHTYIPTALGYVVPVTLCLYEFIAHYLFYPYLIQKL